ENLAAFETTLAGRYPELAARRGDIAPLTPDGWSQILTNPASVAVEYVVTGEQIFAFVVATDGKQAGVTGRVINIALGDLTARVQRFRKRIASRDFAVTEDARSLYDLLIAPIRGQMSGKSHVIIIPDGVLWALPFQALRGSDGYLIETAAVSYAPS